MRVAIIHPWMPQYRVAFFDRLIADGKQFGIEFQIFHGSPPPEWASRGDSKTHPNFIELPTRFFSFKGRFFNIKQTRQLTDRGPWDLVIVEQAVRNLETYILVFRRSPIAFWGHGKTYTKTVSGLQETIKQALTRRGNWFFSYTSGGAAAVASAGYPVERITVVQNSIDSTALRRDVDELTSYEIEQFRRMHGTVGPTALFMGGLDESKRLSFLLASSTQVANAVPGFKLLIAGDGSERPIVERAAISLSHVAYLGRLSGKEKALALKVSDVIAMPGRVGLLSVDSFTAGRPIVTTDWAWHAPEFEYLTSGINSVVSSDSEDEYADALIDILKDRRRLQQLQRSCANSAAQFSIEEMSSRFVQGVLDARASSNS